MPYGGNFHIPALLQTVAVEYKNNAYIAQELGATVPVAKEADLYYTFNRDMRINEARRANGAVAQEVTWGLSTSSYVLEEWALKDPVTRRDRDQSDVVNIDVQTTEFLTDKINLFAEKQASDLFFTTGNWSLNTTVTSTGAWRYLTTTVLVTQQILSATSAIVKNSGKRPNTFILGMDTYDALKLAPDLINRIQYVDTAIGQKNLIASIFDIPANRVFVGEAMYDAGIEGVQVSLTTFWGPHAWLGYIETSPGMKKLSAAYQFKKANMGNGKSYLVKKWREEARDADMIEVSTMGRWAPVATLCAYLFKDAAV